MKESFKSGEEFGSNIRKIRQEKGLTLEEMGAKANLSQSYLSDVERGNIKSPGIDVIKRIAEALEVSIDKIADTNLSEEREEDSSNGSTLNYESSGIDNKMLEKALEYPATKIVVRAFADSEVSDDTKKDLDNMIGTMFSLVLHN